MLIICNKLVVCFVKLHTHTLSHKLQYFLMQFSDTTVVHITTLPPCCQHESHSVAALRHKGGESSTRLRISTSWKVVYMLQTSQERYY